MNCLTDCQQCKCLNAPCFGLEDVVLVIGFVDQDDQVNIYITNNSSGRTELWVVQPEAYGVISINMADKPGFFHPNADYTAWVTAIDDDMMATVDITIDAIAYTCLRFSFERSFNNDQLSTLEVQYLEPNL